MAENHMISPICPGVNDFDRAGEFYAAVLGELGLVLKFREDYFGAYFRGPDGNKLCIRSHQPG